MTSLVVSWRLGVGNAKKEEMLSQEDPTETDVAVIKLTRFPLFLLFQVRQDNN